MPVILALVLFFSVITGAAAVSAADAPVTALKQIDLAKKLIDTFDWSEGLPEKPADKDYLAILSGNRTFRFEAEDIFDQQSDAVSVRNAPLFGAFTGGGWINGTSSQTAVHFRAFIPISDRYTFKVTARGDEQLWSIAGRAFKASFGPAMKEVTVGQVFIPAGYLDFNSLIPPAAGIDALLFTAPARAAIEPFAGWNLNAPLTAAALAETASALLGNEPSLPEDPSYPKATTEASTAPLPAGAQLTDSQIYGKPAAGKWVRAGQVPVTLAVPIAIEKSGVYHFRVRCMGTELTAGFDVRKVTLPAKPFLDWIDIGTFRLQAGVQTLNLQLPPTGGVDLIETSRKLSTPAAYLAINKLGSKGDAVLSPEDLDAAVKSLHEQFKERK